MQVFPSRFRREEPNARAPSQAYGNFARSRVGHGLEEVPQRWCMPPAGPASARIEKITPNFQLPSSARVRIGLGVPCRAAVAIDLRILGFEVLREHGEFILRLFRGRARFQARPYGQTRDRRGSSKKASSGGWSHPCPWPGAGRSRDARILAPLEGFGCDGQSRNLRHSSESSCRGLRGSLANSRFQKSCPSTTTASRTRQPDLHPRKTASQAAAQKRRHVEFYRETIMPAALYFAASLAVSAPGADGSMSTWRSRRSYPLVLK